MSVFLNGYDYTYFLLMWFKMAARGIYEGFLNGFKLYISIYEENVKHRDIFYVFLRQLILRWIFLFYPFLLR